MLEYLLKILKGVVIGVANVIPSVSGGTMAVSMGIYDTVIFSVAHLFKQFGKSVKTLLPYGIGMLLGIVGLAFAVEFLFARYPLPTITAFIGLILGGLPVIVRRMRGKTVGVAGALLFAAFFALIIVLPMLKSGGDAAVALSAAEIVKLLFIGVLASATMVVPGVSGSMILMLIGYYNPVISSITGLMSGLRALDMAAVGQSLGLLLPFGVGIVVGIFLIAKLIEMLLQRFEGLTYCAILGLVTASPVALLLGAPLAGASPLLIAVSVVTLALGFAGAYALSEKK